MRETAKQKTSAEEWLRLKDNEEFLRIVRLLVEFDERTGRDLKYNDPETHFMRKAVANADPGKISAYLKHVGGFVYSVVVELKSTGGLLATAWIHEDGIRQERSDREAGHPVHDIVCVTDLYEKNCVRPEPDFSDVGAAALDLMMERQ